MARRTDLDPQLLARARSGKLTRQNTEKGTPERQAVDRVQYLRRRERRPNLTARQALGHPKATDRLPKISLLVEDPPRIIVVEGLTRRDLSRAGRYADLVSKLANGRITPDAFRRRVGSWRPIAGFRFLADPDAVLAILEERRATDQQVFVYDSGRAA